MTRFDKLIEPTKENYEQFKKASKAAKRKFKNTKMTEEQKKDAILDYINEALKAGETK
jgi:hypothetical protein